VNPVPSEATAPPAAHPTLVRQGAGAGAAVGGALGTCIALGTAASVWWPQNGSPNFAVPVGILLALALVGTVCGALVGWAVPVAETKADTQIGIH
jgi:hypothetical protein